MWRDDATATPPQLLAEVSYDEGTQGEQRGRKEKEAAHRPGLFTRNGPINPRDRCYLFIILLNVDRRGAKATALLSTPRYGDYIPKYYVGLMRMRGWRER